jgi:predicted metal-dependent enzyme (double-stranded beta helix superfamily)
MKPILSLKKLSELLDLNSNLPLFDKIKIVNSYNGLDWKDYLSYNKNQVYSRVEIPCNSCDIFVITWKPFGISGVHNHASQGCIMKYLGNNGFLFEHRYNNEKPYKYLTTSILFSNKISYIHDSLYLHSIENKLPNYSFTLHIYQPKGFHTKFFT